MDLGPLIASIVMTAVVVISLGVSLLLYYCCRRRKDQEDTLPKPDLEKQEIKKQNRKKMRTRSSRGLGSTVTGSRMLNGVDTVRTIHTVATNVPSAGTIHSATWGNPYYPGYNRTYPHSYIGPYLTRRDADSTYSGSSRSSKSSKEHGRNEQRDGNRRRTKQDESYSGRSNGYNSNGYRNRSYRSYSTSSRESETSRHSGPYENEYHQVNQNPTRKEGDNQHIALDPFDPQFGLVKRAPDWNDQIPTQRGEDTTEQPEQERGTDCRRPGLPDSWRPA